MKIGRVMGDATPGALYNIGWNELWVSFDYGESWEYRENFPDNGKYISGQIEGLITRIIGPELALSTDYGNNFTVILNPINCPIREQGYIEGEYFGINGNIGEGLLLDHTLDYGQTYTEITIDSTVAFWQVGSNYPEISRGTEPGELYLMSWWPGSYYKIFHSVDTGFTWTEKFESVYINTFYWGVSYTAGRVPGSFYVTRSTQSPTQSHLWLYIDYSSDYGETFTTWFHDLDSTYTSVDQLEVADIKITVSPNPFTGKATFGFNLPANTKKQLLNIYNVKGELVKQYDITKKNRQHWYGSNNNGNLVPAGIYLYNIQSGSFTSQFHKLLFIH